MIASCDHSRLRRFSAGSKRRAKSSILGGEKTGDPCQILQTPRFAASRRSPRRATLPIRQLVRFAKTIRRFEIDLERFFASIASSCRSASQRHESAKDTKVTQPLAYSSCPLCFGVLNQQPQHRLITSGKFERCELIAVDPAEGSSGSRRGADWLAEIEAEIYRAVRVFMHMLVK